MWFLWGAAGAVGGFIWRQRHSNRSRKQQLQLQAQATGRPLGDLETGDVELVLATLSKAFRRSLITSIVLFRGQILKAFANTAKNYAPVPLTFTSAIFSSFPAIFGTTFFSNLATYSGVELLQIFIIKHSSRAIPGNENSNQDNELDFPSDMKIAGTHVACFGVASIGYFTCQERWNRGPLRGTLSVFGASPRLDRCASSERYLAEKLVLLAYGGFKKVATIRQMGLLRSETALETGESVLSLTTYASDSMHLGTALHNLEKVYGEYAKQYVEQHAEMQEVAKKLKYPPHISHIEPALSEISNIKMLLQHSKDISEKLQDLHIELGEQVQVRVLTFGMSVIAGFIVGVEASDRIPIITL
ncbi:hypothetical protein CYMTET_19070 [Cymbomonas tetramitiformis]|uniref:Uncharacterized protein n=1 Tax=Cymbomonas tetramitiformis TaxID=36881 RepID=A0AAE0G6X3_9CHLO|nr:hypothetical protein CYMTET_19070 [Cymbomonas tetramitiformis]